MVMIFRIGEIEQLDMDAVGGKAYNLNRLSREGLPVPEGIIIDNHYFEEGCPLDLLPYLDAKKQYAVRSSAIDEDGTRFSFAGLQDTFLNVVYQDIEERVKECYQSQFSARATEYRRMLNIGSSKGMAVIVQEMVDADYAGVVFTQNPLNNRIDQFVVEVVEGLGEKLVSGQHTPTTYIMSRCDFSISEIKDYGAMLETQTLRLLLDHVIHIEQIYQSPQDIEFAIKDGLVYILQARPITTTSKVPERKKDGLRFYISFGHIQNMTYPMTPVGAEMIQVLFSYRDHEPLRDSVLYNGEFVFVDISGVLLTPSFIFKRICSGLLNINFDLPELATEYRRLNTNRVRVPFSLGITGVRFLRRIIKIARDPHPSARPMKEWLEAHYQKYANYSEKELIENRSNVLFPMFAECGPYLAVGMLSFMRIEKLFEKWHLDMSDFQKLLAGVTGNITTEMGLHYDDLLLHYGSEEGERLLTEYIDLYGMRVDGEIDLGRIRPYENIEGFRARLVEMKKEHNGESLRERHRMHRRESDAIKLKLKSQLDQKRYKQLNRWITLMESYMVLREYPKHTIMRIFKEYRTLVDNPFMTLNEKYNGGCDPQILAIRERNYAEAQGKTPPFAMLSNGLILKPQHTNDNNSIKGFGVSGGIIRGKVRVISNIDDDILQAGEILVTRFTDPGWTPMFARAGGIVTEVGGMMTHGAIVSREYGIPAVVGVAEAVKRFKTGDEITIDGNSGEITTHPKSEK